MSETEVMLEETLDIAEQTMDALEATPQITKQDILITAVVVSGIVGTATYFITKKYLKTKYEKIAADEIAEAKEFYRALNKKEDFSTPEKAAAKLISKKDETDATNALRTYQGADSEDESDAPVEDEEDVEEVEESSVNVFIEHTVDDTFDIEEEMRNRTPEHPYVINEQEFMENEDGFSQTTITYYEGDGTLADDRDQEIPYIEPVVGQDNLERFGHGSGDERIVYIRNERLSSDFEVIKSDGKYAHEVLGFEHSDGGSRGRQQRNQLRKYRGEDE